MQQKITQLAVKNNKNTDPLDLPKITKQESMGALLTFLDQQGQYSGNN